MKKSLKNAPELCHRLAWEEIDPEYLKKIIELAKNEDCSGEGLVPAKKPKKCGDATSEVSAPKSKIAEAKLVARKNCALSGLRIVPELLLIYGGNAGAACFANDGDEISAGTTLAKNRGNAKEMLSAERILLNFLQRMSGIATETAKFVKALAGTKTKLLDTRKTTPGHRVLEKYAVGCGGAWNHRIGLFDRLMLKDNHLAADEAVAGTALANLVKKAKAARPDLLCEVEVDDLSQIPPVLEAGADIILLDNFSVPELRKAVEIIGENAWTEISGGVSLESLPALGNVGADFVSTGSITHNFSWIDIGLDWEE